MREKGDRSFSEVIAAMLDERSRLMDVTGSRILEPETIHEVKREIGRLSDDTVERFDSPPDN